MFGAKPEHPLLREVITRLPWSCFSGTSIDTQTGPGLLTRVVKEGKWEQNLALESSRLPSFIHTSITNRGGGTKTSQPHLPYIIGLNCWNNDQPVHVAWTDLTANSLGEMRQAAVALKFERRPENKD